MTTKTMSADLRLDQEKNTELNTREFLERRPILSSTPQRVFMQINAACNADCVFCSKGYDYPEFSLDDYLKGPAREMTPVIARARELILTGSGEFLGLPDAERILEYFNARFPHVDKHIATNASHARPRIWELIVASGSRYTLQLSLHASDEGTHRLMMRFGAYKQVMKNVRTLLDQRKKTGGPKIDLMFIMTTLNIEGLPDFVRFGAELGADKIIAGYFNIYESSQKYLSLFFKQDLANRFIDEARRVAAELKVDLRLPAKFGEAPEAYAKPECCPEAWHQIMINADGRVLPCDVHGDFPEDLSKKSFKDIWNGPAYRKLRESLGRGEGCIETCARQNAASVNEWDSHVIHRHRDDKQILRQHREAMKKP